MPSTLATLRAFLERLQSPDCLSAAVELLKAMLHRYPQLAGSYQVSVGHAIQELAQGVTDCSLGFVTFRMWWISCLAGS